MDKCPTCELINSGGMFIDAECAKHPKWFKITDHNFKAGELLVNVKFEIITPLGTLTGSDVIYYKHLKDYDKIALQELKEYFNSL
jgi:hypothetical protein